MVGVILSSYLYSTANFGSYIPYSDVSGCLAVKTLAPTENLHRAGFWAVLCTKWAVSFFLPQASRKNFKFECFNVFARTYKTIQSGLPTLLISDVGQAAVANFLQAYSKEQRAQHINYRFGKLCTFLTASATDIKLVLGKRAR